MKLYKNYSNSRNAAYKEKHEQMELWMSLFIKSMMDELLKQRESRRVSWTEFDANCASEWKVGQKLPDSARRSLELIRSMANMFTPADCRSICHTRHLF